MEFVAFRENDEHNGVGFLKITKLFDKQDRFFIETEPCTTVYLGSINLDPLIEMSLCLMHCSGDGFSLQVFRSIIRRHLGI